MRRPRTLVLRTAALLLVAAGAVAVAAQPSHAAGWGDPLGSVTDRVTDQVSEQVTDPLPTLPVPLPALPAEPAPSSPAGSSPATATPGGAAATSSGSTADSPDTADGSQAGTAAPPKARTTPAPPGQRAAAAGSSAPPASHVAAVDASVQGLVGACVRVTREVAPLETTLVVLDHDLVRQLTAAGLPPQQLVAPCPAGSSNSPQAAVAVSSTTDGSSLSQADQVTALSALGRLAFTGAHLLPTVLAGLGLLTLGALLVRTAGLVPVRGRH